MTPPKPEKVNKAGKSLSGGQWSFMEFEMVLQISNICFKISNRSHHVSGNWFLIREG